MPTRTGITVAAFVATLAAACSSNTTVGGFGDSGTPDSASGRDANPIGQDSGGTDSAPPDTGTPQDTGTPDTNPPLDAGKDAVAVYDFGCAGPPCPTTTVCCTHIGATTTFTCDSQASCPPEDKFLCDGPDECGGATPYCCGVETTDGTGNYPQCGAKSLGTSCSDAANCPTHIGQSCTDTTTVVVCHVNADCTDATNNQCCTFMSNGGSLTFCIDSLTASLGGGVCHP